MQFSLHVSDRLVHHQENQITRAASGTFPSFVVISCVAVGAKWLTQLAPTATRDITTKEGKVPEAARVIWFSWWWTSRSETCRENCKKKIVNVKENKSVSSWKRKKDPCRRLFQGCTYPGLHVASAMRCCNVAPKWFRNMELRVAELAPRILRFLLGFWWICVPLLYSAVTCFLTAKELMFEVNKTNV